ncbi:hypothetical protein BJY52DRAFT_1227179 [Lactarius psammicola]|nr:hypothetical protein BJY52DRAFT_1227179 [Lactarius psammicola]
MTNPQFPLIQGLPFRALDYGMENCSLAPRIPKYGQICDGDRACRIYVWSLTVDTKVDLRRFSYRTLSRHIDKVGSFTPRYQLLSFTCESRAYHAFLLARPQGTRKQDSWVDATSTKEKPIRLYLVQHQTGQRHYAGMVPIVSGQGPRFNGTQEG